MSIEVSDTTGEIISATGEVLGRTGEAVAGIFEDWEAKDWAILAGSAVAVGLGAVLVKKIYDKVTE